MLFISFIFILNLINNNLSYYYDILVHDLQPQMYIVKFSLPQHLNKEKRKRAAISTNGRRFDSFLTDHWNHQCLILNWMCEPALFASMFASLCLFSWQISTETLSSVCQAAIECIFIGGTVWSGFLPKGDHKQQRRKEK